MPVNSGSDLPGENPLLQELGKYEMALREWAGRSSINALWLLSDPVGALREARLGLDEALLAQLADVPPRDLAALLRRNAA